MSDPRRQQASHPPQAPILENPGPNGFVILPSGPSPVKANREAMLATLKPAEFVHFDATTEALRSQKAQSPTLSQLDQAVHQAQQTRFESIVNKAATRYERAFPEGHVAPEHAPTNIARTMLANSFKPLSVEYHAGQSPHYNPTTNSVSVMMSQEADALGHELQHAHDHLSGALDLTENTHKLHSELRAFTTQAAISQELTGKNPKNFEQNSPVEMARSYQGKVEKGYVGTLESSQEAVQQWRLRQPK